MYLMRSKYFENMLTIKIILTSSEEHILSQLSSTNRKQTLKFIFHVKTFISIKFHFLELRQQKNTVNWLVLLLIILLFWWRFSVPLNKESWKNLNYTSSGVKITLVLLVLKANNKLLNNLSFRPTSDMSHFSLTPLGG